MTPLEIATDTAASAARIQTSAEPRPMVRARIRLPRMAEISANARPASGRVQPSGAVSAGTKMPRFESTTPSAEGACRGPGKAWASAIQKKSCKSSGVLRITSI